MELKVITPRLMRTEAVLVVRYIPLRIQLRSELQATDLQGLDSGPLPQEAEGSRAEGGGQVPVAAFTATTGSGVRGLRRLVGALRYLVARQSAVATGDWSPTGDGVALPGQRKLEAIRTLPGARSEVGRGVRIFTDC